MDPLFHQHQKVQVLTITNRHENTTYSLGIVRDIPKWTGLGCMEKSEQSLVRGEDEDSVVDS